ncbi:MAG: PUA domain-containing protein [Candidatus Jordarchaeales archaeon]
MITVDERIAKLAEQHRFPPDIVALLSETFGFEKCERILTCLRTPPPIYYLRVNTMLVDRDKIIDMLEEIGIRAIPHPQLEEAVGIPVEGPFEIEPCEKKVVADKFACESVMMGADLYVPGVISAKDVKKGDRVAIVDKHGEQIALGIALMNSKEILAARKGVAVKVVKSIYKVPSIRGTPLYEEGYVYEQSLPSILTSRILDPKPGSLVVDMCAAPGGKATHIAQLMRGEGLVLAFDRSKARACKMEEQVRRMKLKNVIVAVKNSLFLDLEYPNLKADAVLVDPPCSDLGVRPKLYEEKNLEAIKAVARYQRQFLKVAARLLKPGGVLVYSTCTLTVEENEDNVEFCINELGFEVEEQQLYLGSRGVKGKSASFVQRFFPDTHETPGFFIAKMRKVKDTMHFSNTCS